jgi:TonB dependent receptor/Carboxypeptidase regulatory-like domain
MRRLNRMLATAAIASVAGAIGGASPVLAQSTPQMQGQTARMLRGRISGTVSDDRGGPLAGALVSAIGATMATTVSDGRGYFSLEALPSGDYILQAHLTGFSGSPRERVRVGATVPATYRLQLRRLETVVGTSGAMQPVSARPIMAAGFGLPSSTLSDQPDSEKTDPDGDHPHTETAWRLRHIKRGILKDVSPVATLVERDPDLRSEGFFGKAVDSAASLAATVFNDLPFSGEVNLLTTGAFAPGGLFAGNTLPRGVAYFSIGAPTPAGDWSARAAMSQGDLSSWIVAGSFASRATSAHAYTVGVSYSTQEYLGGNLAALQAVTDGSRNVGELYGFDRWAISSRLTLDYGGRYAHYDYLQERGMFSPRIGLTVEPIKNTRVTTTIAQRRIAPGAEEFLATGVPGPWIPPERTFAPLSGNADTDFRVERARYVDVGLEHSFDDSYVLGVHRFFQDVDDQLVTLFGLNLPEGPRSVGHYYVASVGGVAADGWAFRMTVPASKRVHGSVDYSVTHARWLTRGEDVSAVARRSPASVRPEAEDLHDITTSFEADIPETATRVFVLYKMNTGFSRGLPDLRGPGFDSRFDVQVNQALPIEIAGTRWEVLVGVRNFFRDPSEPGSVYDELLVVRPPKRVVGGFLVRF